MLPPHGPVDPFENEAQRRRLAELVGRLTAEQLETPLGEHCTVAVALAHLAFWDRRGLLLLERWERGDVPPRDDPRWFASEVLNDALLAEWRALPPAEAARLALEAAEAIDQHVANLRSDVLDAIEARDEGWRVRRSRHRREHLDEIEAALSAGATR